VGPPVLQDSQDRTVVLGRLVLQELQDQWGHKDSLVLKVLRVSPVVLVTMVPQGSLELKAQGELLDNQVSQELLGLQDLQAHRGS